MDGNYNHQQGPHDDTIAFMPPVIALQASTLQLKEPTTDTVHNELALVDTQPQVKNLEAHSRTGDTSSDMTAPPGFPYPEYLNQPGTLPDMADFEHHAVI